MEPAPVSHDTLLGGRLVLRQSRAGYRFTLDAVLLAGIAARRGGIRVLDIGAGCGPVALALTCWLPQARVTAVEVQESLAQHLAFNVVRNGLEARVTVICGDIRDVAEPVEPADLVVMNPPYFERHRGRLPPEGERAVGRHQLRGTIGELVAAAAGHLGPEGRLEALYRAGDAERFVAAAAAAGLRSVEVTRILSYSESEARVCVFRCRRAARAELREAAPLVVHLEPTRYTDEALALLAGP